MLCIVTSLQICTIPALVYGAKLAICANGFLANAGAQAMARTVPSLYVMSVRCLSTVTLIPV